jgi:hypothetical protein
VCLADPSWIDLVLIGGDLAYARTDWFTTLAAQHAGPTIDTLTAWGKPMTLDTGYHAPANDPLGPGGAGAPPARPHRRSAARLDSHLRIRLLASELFTS